MRLLLALVIVLVLAAGPDPARAQVSTGACRPRPPVELRLLPRAGGFRLLVWATPTAFQPDNLVTAVRVVDQRGAVVRPFGEDAHDRPFTWAARDRGAPVAAFELERSGTGRVQLALVVTDLCGPWPTLVGAP